MDTPGVIHENRETEFTRLLAGWQRRIFLYALSLVQNAADAEDVLQETNLVLWRKFDQFRPGSDFGRWAFRVAYYEVLKFREKNGSRRIFSNEFIDVLAAENHRGVDEAEARREALARCLEKIRPGDRELVTRRYEPEASTRSVAEALGRSVQGTRKSLHRIRNTLLACIQRRLAAEERT